MRRFSGGAGGKTFAGFKCNAVVESNFYVGGRGYRTCHLLRMYYLCIMQLSIKEYIEQVKPTNKEGKTLTRQGVLWRINHNLPLPELVKLDKIGKQFVITINH